MTTEEKNIRLIIRKTLSEIENVSESDILVRAGVNWDEVKPKFLETINDLVAKIDDDKYDEVERLIMQVMGMLKIWRAKIRKGKEMVDRISNVETLDEIDVNEYFGGPNPNSPKDLTLKDINIEVALEGLNLFRNYQPELFYKYFPNINN